MQQCQVCQKQNPAGVEYCEDCGAALGQAESAQPAASPSATPAPPTTGNPSDPTLPASAPATPSPDPTGAAEQWTPEHPDTSATPSQPSAPSTTPDGPPATPPSTGANGASGTPASHQRPRLLVKRFGAATGDEVPLMADRMVVGRFDPETGPVDIDLSSFQEAQHVSRQHGEVYRESDGRWFVRDLGSTNGVFVRGGQDTAFGPRITAPRELAPGDEVAFGNARFEFRAD